ncbi:hypothetical protein V6N13_061824 [Hibiscus sabdariffa]|uniref:Uncharacterized protein n=2 Tax=Hibiscus sabdariffa TaxID=183260 RepID=A0ABR2B2C5_9ROSI
MQRSQNGVLYKPWISRVTLVSPTAAKLKPEARVVDALRGWGGYGSKSGIDAQLARRCLSLDGRNRPTLKEIAMELARR